MNVNPGEMTKRIEILEKVEAVDHEGYRTGELSLVRRCWAKMTRASGTELLKANGDFAEVQIRFLTYAPDMTLSRKMVVRYGGLLYEITYRPSIVAQWDYVPADTITALLSLLKTGCFFTVTYPSPTGDATLVCSIDYPTLGIFAFIGGVPVWHGVTLMMEGQEVAP